VGVTFTPAATGPASGSLTFTDNALTSPQSVALSGSGSAPVTFSANTLSFGFVAHGTTSAAKSVTVTNHLNVSLNLTSIVASPSAFAISANTCGASIPAGANCTVSVTFSPAAAGSVSGSLVFTDAAATSPQKVTLSGTGY
jgi:hypothetical protein